jgi:hypothetical protein
MRIPSKFVIAKNPQVSTVITQAIIDQVTNTAAEKAAEQVLTKLREQGLIGGAARQ